MRRGVEIDGPYAEPATAIDPIELDRVVHGRLAPADPANLRVATTRSHPGPAIERAIESLAPAEVVRAGGAGCGCGLGVRVGGAGWGEERRRGTLVKRRSVSRSSTMLDCLFVRMSR